MLTEDKPRPYKFAEAVSDQLINSFDNLASEIMKENALSSKDKSLIALACSVAINCHYCIKAHKEHAIKAGATQQEILEAAAVAGQVRLGSTFTYASFIIEDNEE
ncbi:MAG: carboxymuconolactone decarboxylase family protein [Methanobacteriaceae archaeon]|nr:carboxymuconolactone decarboxylase family protein [Methanobacteriaceae archaeon]